MTVSKSHPAILIGVGLSLLLAPVACTLGEAPSGHDGAVGWKYVSKVGGPIPYPTDRLLKWSDLKGGAIESKDRPSPPWTMGAEGAKHPVVFFDPADLPKIRERLKKGAGPRIMTHLRRNAESGSPAQSGLYSALTGDESFAKKAVPNLLTAASRNPGTQLLRMGGHLYALATGYDLLYNYMTPEQRETVRVALDKRAQEMFLRPPYQGMGNWLPHCWGALGIAGFALQEENRYAESWILTARLANLRDMHNTFDPDGADYEALSRYFAMGVDKVLICFAAERRQGRDFFGYKDSVFGRVVEFCAYMLLPTRIAWVPFDDAFLKDVDFPHVFATIAGLTGDPLAQGLFESVYPPPRRTWVGNVMMAASFYDPSVRLEKPSESARLSLARAHWAKRGKKGSREWSSGHVFLRTGYDSRDDILFATQCGDTGGWHGHADQASFGLYAYGDTLVQDPAIVGSYGQPLCEWMKGPEAHSLVLIDGQSVPDYTVGDKLNWPKRFHHGGDVEGFVHTDTLDFVSMDFLEGLALNPKVGKARRGKRYVVFFRHPKRTGYFVIVDDVIKDDSPRRYEWLLQPDKEHKVVKEGPGKFAFTGRVDLKIRMIEPQDPAHTTATFKGYGVDYLRVRSKENRSRGLFFTILYPKKKDMSVPPITEIRQDGVIGAKIGEDIVLFRTRDGGVMDAGGVKSDGELVAIRIADGAPTGAVVMGGRFLRVNGKDVAFIRPGPPKRP